HGVTEEEAIQKYNTSKQDELGTRDIMGFVAVMEAVPQRVVGMHYDMRWEEYRIELSRGWSRIIAEL
ncbi:5095_t:CDS:2, partial [Paraglomus occultum]